MKILELKFQNLNSLYGEWAIDFTSPDYVSNGIFAITGPTGAGKSTIMDAICLALYGTTPRLGRITASGNEIMSRQTGDCYAEVTFTSQAGTFRCHWSQHKARKKADGKLAEARHEIADAVSGQILESQKRDVARVIEEKTGMDFDRFTRSILLAQGGFAAFLQAAPDERAPVLEQITGTEIYSAISKRAHERLRDERASLDLLQAEISGITVLNDEQVALLQNDLQVMIGSDAATAAKNQAVKASLQWLAGIDALQVDLAGISQENELIMAEIEVFQPEREKLRQAQKAADLEGEYSALAARRRQLKNDLDALKSTEDQLPQADFDLQQKQTALKNAAIATAKAKEAMNLEAPLIRKVRALDLLLSEKLQAVEAAEAEWQKLAAAIVQDQANRNQAADNLVECQQDLQQILAYLAANCQDEILISQLAGITEQVNNLHAAAQDIAARQILAAAAIQEAAAGAKCLETCSKIFGQRQEEQAAASKNVLQEKEALSAHLGGRLLREYRSDRDGLLREQAYLQKIASLEDDRRRLEDGQPCPLCGSREHPFAAGNVPEPDEVERRIQELAAFIGQAEDLETNIKALELNEQASAAGLVEADKQLAQAINQKTGAETELNRLNAELAAMTERLAKFQAGVLSGLQPLGIKALPETNIRSILPPLQKRRQQWLDHFQKKEQIEKRSSELTAEMNRLDAVLRTLEKSGQDKQSALSAQKLACDLLQKERQELYGAKNPDAEEIRLGNQAAGAEMLEQAAREAQDQAKELFSGINTRIASLQESIRQQEPALASLETSFLASLFGSGFADEASFMANRLSVGERSLLLDRAAIIDHKQADILSRRKDRAERLAQELARNITDSTKADLTRLQEEYEEKLRFIGEQIGALKQKLIDNQMAKEKIQLKQAAIAAQKKECQRWEKLHSLIGSADGKKYRNFAQGLTFELMVSHANRQLEKMTDRYLLIRDEEQPLELNVIDNYQAGEIRSTKNLSGGESFIVSLALALGLSKMASRKVRIDSLFLDEGFGTLDEEALETALEMLAGLHQDGKLIGIISHVSALKERISTQINIVPGPGGKSTIAGPGVRAVFR